MILKISDGKPSPTWTFYDGIDHIEVDAKRWRVQIMPNHPTLFEVIERRDDVLRVGANSDMTVLREGTFKQKDIGDNVTVCRIYFRRDISREVIYSFNAKAYLLNDDGKTIEKLN